MPDIKAMYQIENSIESSDTEKKNSDTKKENSELHIMEPLPLTHKFFYPRKYQPERFTTDNKIHSNYNTEFPATYANTEDIIEYYNKKYPSYPANMVLLKGITNAGTINPLKTWVIDAAYDLL